MLLLVQFCFVLFCFRENTDKTEPAWSRWHRQTGTVAAAGPAHRQTHGQALALPQGSVPSQGWHGPANELLGAGEVAGDSSVPFSRWHREWHIPAARHGLGGSVPLYGDRTVPNQLRTARGGRAR